MKFATSQTIHEHLNFPELIEVLRKGFQGDVLVPQRMHVDYNTPDNHSGSNTLLLMPAIQIGQYAGVKLVNFAPGNKNRNLVSIQGVYYLMDAVSGEPKALFEASSITNWRTAAASALASQLLSRDDSRTLLMIGTGALAPYLVRAHASIRPIDRVIIYGRSKQKAEAMAADLQDTFQSVRVVDTVEDGILEADIISAATSSEAPLIHGAWLQPGQHVDLVGAYKPTTRESDDEVMRRGSIYADNLASALHEAGDLIIPIQTGVMTAEDMAGDLFGLCQGEAAGRTTRESITVFKSVGHAMEDLATAVHLYQKLFGA